MIIPHSSASHTFYPSRSIPKYNLSPVVIALRLAHAHNSEIQSQHGYNLSTPHQTCPPFWSLNISPSENVQDFGLLFVEKYLLPKKKHFFFFFYQIVQLYSKSLATLDSEVVWKKGSCSCINFFCPYATPTTYGRWWGDCGGYLKIYIFLF